MDCIAKTDLKVHYLSADVLRYLHNQSLRLRKKQHQPKLNLEYLPFASMCPLQDYTPKNHKEDKKLVGYTHLQHIHFHLLKNQKHLLFRNSASLFFVSKNLQ